MKKAILFVFTALLTAGALVGCGKDSGKANGQYVDPYGNQYNYNSTGVGSLGYVFGDTASILDIRNYREFLRGDVCTHFLFFNFTCKMVDNPPVVVLALQKLEMKGNNDVIYGRLTINIMPDYGTTVNGNPVPRKDLNMRFVYAGSTNVLDGQANDWFTEGSGIPRQVRVRITGLNKNSTTIPVEIWYDGRPMLTAYLRR